MGLKLVVGAALAGVLNTLWIGLAIAAVTWALGRFLPRTNAATRYLLGWAAYWCWCCLLPFAALQREPVRDADAVPDGRCAAEALSLSPTNAPDAAVPLAPPAIFPLHLHEKATGSRSRWVSGWCSASCSFAGSP